MSFRTLALLLYVSGVAVLASACRYEVVFEGAEFDETGSELHLAAAEPLCGCLAVTNTSNGPVTLVSSIDGQKLGETDVAAGAQYRVQFDWAGPEGDHFYIVTAWDAANQQVPASSVLRLDDSGWPWHPCEGVVHGAPPVEACEIGTLKLEMGRARAF